MRCASWKILRVDHRADVEVVHVADHDANLTERHTPDWYFYLRAARDGFNALVTRDASQLGLPKRCSC